ncbi:YbaB/EbfC family nucleoid-associated protein [Saccharomonospora sp. NPDC006951]
MPDSIEASERMVDDWNRRVQEQARRYQAMAERVEAVSVTEHSRDNAVEVTVNSKGLLTDLVISDAVQGKRMAEVSQQVMRTVQAAQARLPDLLRQAMTETVGTEDQAVNKVFHDAKAQFPQPPEDEPQPPPHRELRFGPEDEEQDAPPPVPPSQSTESRPKPRSRPRRHRPGDDDDDFGGRSILS